MPRKKIDTLIEEAVILTADEIEELESEETEEEIIGDSIEQPLPSVVELPDTKEFPELQEFTVSDNHLGMKIPKIIVQKGYRHGKSKNIRRLN